MTRIHHFSCFCFNGIKLSKLKCFIDIVATRELGVPVLNQNKVCFQAFYKKYAGRIDQKRKNDFFNVSNSTLLNKNLTFI